FDVVDDVPELHRPEALEVRAVRIAFFIRERMMLAMDGYPLARDEARRDPQREAEQPGDQGIEHQRSMRLAPMQIDGRAKDGDLCDQRGHQHGDDERNEHRPSLLTNANAERLELRGWAERDEARRLYHNAGTILPAFRCWLLTLAPPGLSCYPRTRSN